MIKLLFKFFKIRRVVKRTYEKGYKEGFEDGLIQSMDPKMLEYFLSKDKTANTD